MLRSYFIFIVGCPASGKSTLAQIIRNAFTIFEFSSDLAALEEIFLINDLVVNCIQEKKSGLAIDKSFSRIVRTALFWKDLLDKRIQQLKERSLKIDRLETMRTVDGGHRIIKPSLWDEALRRSIKVIESSRFVIFEFCRGTDWAYMEEFKVTASGIYHRCFSIICDAIPSVREGSSLILTGKPPALPGDSRRFDRVMR